MTGALSARLREGSAAFGVTLTIPDPFVAEVFAAQSFDFLMIDTEHSPISMYRLQNQLIALRTASASVLVRVPHNDPTAIMQVLDLGASGVVVPHVETAEECSRAVRAAFYPPLGERGIGPRRAQRVGARGSYLRTANDATMVVAMLESRLAVENVDEILRVQGLGGVIIGSADLAASLGHIGDQGQRDVVNAIDLIFDRCLAVNVPFGIYAASPEEAESLARRGARLITVGSDLLFLEQQMGRVAQQMASVGRRRVSAADDR
ncbi:MULTISPECIES: HpcH/HpaI aldolase family protein [unclassified Streptomyces]|uniref:HpcH/HpaI aldolase family protein n=1 Tax=unclassified Streptomyces TaxID=2593676 RepID=UPI003D8F2F69